MVKVVFHFWHFAMPWIAAKLASISKSIGSQVSALLTRCDSLLGSNNALRYACMLCLGFIAVNVMAEGENSNGLAAFEQVTTDIKAYIPKVRNLIYAIAAVVCLVGGFNCYHKFNNDEQDAKKALMMYVGAAILLIAAATAMPLFFVDSGSLNGN